jgi:hypoxia up-regulated 1
MVKREKLEELSNDMLSRIPKLVKQALSEAKVGMDQISAAEVVGGAWRQPKVLSLLTEMLGKDAAGNPKELGQHLNGEEAAALGAAIHAASPSNQYNVKKISFNDIRKYGYALEVTEFDTQKMLLKRDDDASTSLISQGSAKGGPKKKLVLTECPCYKDIKVDLYEKQSDKSAPVLLTTYEVRGVAAVIEKRITNAKQKLNVPSDMPKIVLSLAGDTNNTGIVTLAKAELLIEGSYSAEVDGTQKEKTMKFTDNLKLTVVEHNPRPMNHEEIHNAIEALQATQQHDKDVKKLAGTVNDLESYIYNTNEKLESDSWIAVSTEEMRKELSELLKSTDAWLQEGGSDRKLKDFEEKLHALQGKADPIQERATEAEYRTDLIDWVKDQLSKAQKKQSDLKKHGQIRLEKGQADG